MRIEGWRNRGINATGEGQEGKGLGGTEWA
jgi:hypothetical protein